MLSLQISSLLHDFWTNLSIKDVIEYCLIVGGFSWGIFLQWRYAQRNLFDRLEDFIQKEDTRLDGARVPIISQIRRPEPQRFAYEPIYSNPSLSTALKKLGWKNQKKAEQYLSRAVTQIKQRLDLCEKSLSVQMEQLATAHLALGTIAASRTEHALALSEFQKAEKLHKLSPEFLEHVGLQLVKVGNAETALSYFQKMRAVAEDTGDQLARAWSYRHVAYAYWNSPQNNAWQAQRALRQAIEAFPDHAPPMDVASTWELHGKMRREQGNLKPAVRSYTSALVIYAGQLDQPSGQEYLDRVQKTISSINDEIAAGAQDQHVDDDDPNPKQQQQLSNLDQPDGSTSQQQSQS